MRSFITETTIKNEMASIQASYADSLDAMVAEADAILAELETWSTWTEADVAA